MSGFDEEFGHALSGAAMSFGKKFWFRFVIGMALLFLGCMGLIYYMVEFAAPEAVGRSLFLGP